MDLEVVVVDEEGRPWERAMVLAGAVVQWRLRAGGCSGDSSQGGALTDGGGKVRFALELEDAEWVRVAASVWVEEGNEWDTGPGPQQWIEAKPGPATVRLVMPRATPLRSQWVSEPARSRDHSTVVRFDGTSEPRPVGGGGRGFAGLDQESLIKLAHEQPKVEAILRLPPEVVSPEAGWIRSSSSLFPHRRATRLEFLEPEIRYTTSAWPVEVQVEVAAANGWIARGRYTPSSETGPVELAAVPPRRITGRVVDRSKALGQGEVRGPIETVPIGADGRFEMDTVPDQSAELCVELEGYGRCRWVPAGGDLEVELDVTPVRIAGRVVGRNWADIADLEIVGGPQTGHTIKPGILLGPEGHFETPDLPAGCYMLWGRLPNHRLGVGAVIRLEPGERAELILDADHPSPETGIGPLSVAEGTCQPIDARVLRRRLIAATTQ